MHACRSTLEDPTLGPRSDLYALGVVLYEMLSGTLPFRGAHVVETMQLHVHATPPPLEPAGGLEQLARSLLAKRAKDRPESAEAVIAALDAVAASAASPAPTPKPQGERAAMQAAMAVIEQVVSQPVARSSLRAPRPRLRKRGLFAAAALGIAIAALVLLIWLR